MPPKEKRAVIKGISKRIVVVKSPDPKVFEEAIFIVKEGYLERGKRIDALKEAQKVANAYIRGAAAPSVNRFRIPPIVWAAAGAILIGIVWALITVL